MAHVPIIIVTVQDTCYSARQRDCASNRVRSLHCALASGAVYCNRSCLCLCVCLFVAGGRCPNLTARAQCLRLSGRFFIISCVSRTAQKSRTNAGELFQLESKILEQWKTTKHLGQIHNVSALVVILWTCYAALQIVIIIIIIINRSPTAVCRGRGIRSPECLSKL